ncbi:hypothetical protein PISL3812_09897 [Talaromyces islandicus]|uniref:Ubiquitin-like domain-containing protein n=1 Tax=Talaromyces islandicus TaxID=28573 RepID=A0A0U1MD00_TALIS|nr:hypothetical protein PISL3812_09897 [Talaromyces islandicus]
MPAPAFGFSVGDFLAGIDLVKDLIKALNDTAGAKPAYQNLIAELLSLQNALAEAQGVQVDDSRIDLKIALVQVASRCQSNIENFLNKNVKFQSSLGDQPTSSKLQTNLHKIQWTLCKEDAINNLRKEITGNTQTLNTLLMTMQLSAAKEHREDIGKILTLVTQCYNLLNTLGDSITGIFQKTQSGMLTILDRVLEIHKLVLPPQINCQQPVSFEDAHGRIVPIHVEFINSFDAFQAVLEVRFRDLPGLRKVQKMEYELHDSVSRRRVNLHSPWESIFLPGRNVAMSIVFRRPQAQTSSCPGCYSRNELYGAKARSETRCSKCSLLYQCITEVDIHPDTLASSQEIPSQQQHGLHDHTQAAMDDDEDEICSPKNSVRSELLKYKSRLQERMQKLMGHRTSQLLKSNMSSGELRELAEIHQCLDICSKAPAVWVRKGTNDAL